MIAAHIDEAFRYGLNARFEKGFKFIKDYIANPLPAGKYEIDGDEVFASVQEYAPKQDSKWEAHLKYIDIQFIADGGESILWGRTKGGTVEEDCTPGKDAILYKDIKNPAALNLEKDWFAIFFPEDAHKPGLKSSFENVKKIVVKIKL